MRVLVVSGVGSGGEVRFCGCGVLFVGSIKDISVVGSGGEMRYLLWLWCVGCR